MAARAWPSIVTTILLASSVLSLENSSFALWKQSDTSLQAAAGLVSALHVSVIDNLLIEE